MKLVRLPLMNIPTLRRKVRNHPHIDLLDYIEAIEYCAVPGDFEEEFTTRHRRFQARKAICKFKWVNPHNTNQMVKFEDQDRAITKLTGK
jgi:hypothetical protein